MTLLYQRVRRTIQRYGLLPPGSRVVVALSGGSDSVALTHLLLALADNSRFAVAGLAHFNHRLRPAADRDEQFCRTLGERLGLALLVDSADVSAYARAEKLSREDAARRLRYGFLHRAADALAADVIAVAHTQDDQAETFLLKLMRGAGLRGLGGIRPRRDRVIRPLIEVTRADLQGYLAARGESWIEDESNEDLAIPRNRIRHRVLPELDLAAGGATRGPIARAAALIREDADWLDEMSRSRYRAIAAETDIRIELDTAALLETPLPLRRRVLLEAMRRLGGGREVGLEHVEAALGLIAAAQGGIDIPGCRMELRAGKVVLLQQGGSVR